MRLSRLYQNEIMPAGFYYAKIVRLNTAYSGNGRPAVEVVVRISDMHGKHGGKELYCPIHSTPNADPIFEFFVGSFDLDENDLRNGIGKYAKIAVKRCHHDGTDFSGVRFIRQNEAAYDEARDAKEIDEANAAAKAEEAKKKAEERARKRMEKEAYERIYGKRGRGRPRKYRGFEGEPDMFDEDGNLA